MEVEALHTQNGSWRRLADLNLGRHGMQALLYQNEVYVIGGSQEKGANEIGRESPYFMEAYTPDVQTARPPTGATQGLRLFPNPAPAGGRLSLSWLQADTGTYEVHLSLLDMRGRQLWQQQVTAACLNAGLWIQLPQKLAAGTYLLQLSSQRQHWAAKLRIR
ncbi:MAG: T9SS C-terminal target domain-containing protein [Bacteroidetes bacterium]|nr:MAG: T9SS C-terminal target domain-containing protein [Bacteroidota bacterium]